MPVSTSLRLFLIGVLLLTSSYSYRLLSQTPAPPTNDPTSSETWLPLDVPCELPMMRSRSSGQTNESIVDFELSPGAPVQLLVSSLGPTQQIAQTIANIEEIQGWPDFRPVPIPQTPYAISEPRLEIDAHPTKFKAVSTPSNQGLSDLNSTHQRPATNRDFWIHVTSDPLENPRGYQLITSQLSCFRNRVQIYVDSSVGQSLQIRAQAEQIAELLEDDVLPALQQHLGPIAHADGATRLSVIMTPWLGRLRGGTTQVKGFVRGTDFQVDLAPPFSNRAAILYLNTDLPHGSALKTVLIHEVAHAANFSQTSSGSNRSTGIEDWLNEGLAHLCERELGGDWSNLDFRTARFLQCPESAPLTVPDYYRENRWRDHACRGAAFLFLEHSFKRLQQPNQSPLPNIVQWQELCRQKVGFEQNFRDWTVALARMESRSSRPQKRGRYLNSGPRFQVWNVTAQRAFSFQVSGMATKFVELRSSHPGFVRLRLPASSLENRWQITLLKPRPEVPDIRLHAEWDASSDSSTPLASIGVERSAQRRITISLIGDMPAGWQCDALTCESTDADKKGVQTWMLNAGNAEDLVQTWLATGRSMTISPTNFQAGSDCILKARLIGPDQRTTWAWCDLPGAPEISRVSSQPEAVLKTQ